MQHVFSRTYRRVQGYICVKQQRYLTIELALQTTSPHFPPSLYPCSIGSAASLFFVFFCSSVVLSSLRHAAEGSGHRLPAEIGGLSWTSFFLTAALVVLQLGKPELEDTEGVYIRVVNTQGVVSSTAADNRGWQGFWAGGGDAFGGTTAADGGSTTGKNAGWLSWCCCFRGRRGNGDGLAGGGAWPIAGGDGALNESLLGPGGFDDRTGAGGTVPFKAEAGARGGGYFQRVGCFISSAVGRRSGATGAAAAAAAAALAAEEEDEEEEGRLRRQGNPFDNLRGGGASIRAQHALGGGSSTSPFSGSASIGARAPPQVAAPVFNVAVSRWRLVDTDGVPTTHGSSGDVMWTERSSRHGSTSSVRTATLSTAATLSGSDLAPAAAEGGYPRDHPDPSSASASAALKDFDVGDARVGSGGGGGGGGGAEPVRVEFELLVRASGRGEMDWWGRGDPGGSTAASAAAASSAATADGDWRVWRSAADTLALYDALALRFGQEFGRRVSRPSFKTHKKHVRFAIEGADDGSRSPPPPSPRDSAAPMQLLPGAFHRVDVLSDAKRVAAFLRSLLGLRQFLR